MLLMLAKPVNQLDHSWW